MEKKRIFKYVGGGLGIVLGAFFVMGIVRSTFSSTFADQPESSTVSFTDSVVENDFELSAPTAQLDSLNNAAYTWNLSNSSIKLPALVELNGAQPLAPQTSIYLGKALKIIPNHNWLMNIDSNKLNCTHINGASLSIVMQGLIEVPSTELLDTTLSSILEESGSAEGYVSDIFLGDKKIGRIANTIVEIETKSYIWDVAIFINEKQLFTLTALYPDTDDEIVKSLYSSISIKEKTVKFGG